MASKLEEQTKAAREEWLESWRKGPTRLRWSRMPPQVGDPAPNVKLRDMEGDPVELRDLWRDQPAVLLFWRQYGCGCGLERAERLRKEYAGYVAAGANVVVIGQGEPERSAAYADKYGIPCPILSDPERQAYDAYGLLEGKPSQIVFDAPEDFLRRDFEAGVRLAKARAEAGRPPVDSPWQLPGEFVVDPRGILRLVYRYQYCEDFPNPLVLIAAIREPKLERLE